MSVSARKVPLRGDARSRRGGRNLNIGEPQSVTPPDRISPELRATPSQVKPTIPSTSSVRSPRVNTPITIFGQVVDRDDIVRPISPVNSPKADLLADLNMNGIQHDTEVFANTSRAPSIQHDLETLPNTSRAPPLQPDLNALPGTPQAATMRHEIDEVSSTSRVPSVRHDIEKSNNTPGTQTVQYDVETLSNNSRTRTVKHQVEETSRVPTLRPTLPTAHRYQVVPETTQHEIPRNLRPPQPDVPTKPIARKRAPNTGEPDFSKMSQLERNNYNRDLMTRWGGLRQSAPALQMPAYNSLIHDNLQVRHDQFKSYQAQAANAMGAGWMKLGLRLYYMIVGWFAGWYYKIDTKELVNKLTSNLERFDQLLLDIGSGGLGSVIVGMSPWLKILGFLTLETVLIMVACHFGFSGGVGLVTSISSGVMSGAMGPDNIMNIVNTVTGGGNVPVPATVSDNFDVPLPKEYNN